MRSIRVTAATTTILVSIAILETRFSVTNNFVYNNTSVGIQVYGNGYYGGTPIISNNTILQNGGVAVYVYDGTSQNVNVTNNIIQVSAGYALKIEPNAARGFISDYNVINITGTGKLGRWENTDFTSRLTGTTKLVWTSTASLRIRSL